MKVTGDGDAAKTIVSERTDEFGAGLVGAVQSHELARAIGLPVEEHRKVHAALLENFCELKNSDDAALRILLKTKRYKLVKDAQSALSIKRCRDGAVAGVGSGTGTTDEEPRAKVAKTQVRKVPLTDVRDTVERVVERFEVVVAGLCDEIRRLREQLKAVDSERTHTDGECVSANDGE
jgi:hypothetical protein